MGRQRASTDYREGPTAGPKKLRVPTHDTSPRHPSRSGPTWTLVVLVALLAFAAGVFAGREWLKHEIVSGVKDAFSGFANDSKDDLAKVDTEIAEANAEVQRLQAELEAGDGHKSRKASADERHAIIMVKDIAVSAYPLWTMSTGEDCPESLSELSKYRNNTSLKDPWGNRIVMLCGESAPEGLLFVALSLGPDGKRGTDDDIRSDD